MADKEKIQIERLYPLDRNLPYGGDKYYAHFSKMNSTINQLIDAVQSLENQINVLKKEFNQFNEFNKEVKNGFLSKKE